MKFLVPVDFTEITNPLLRVVKKLAEAHSAHVFLLHCVPPLLYIPYPESFGMSTVDLELLSQLQERKKEEANQRLKGLARFLEPLKVELIVEVGDAGEIILDREALADLVLLGSHKKGLIERILVGSTTEKVLKYSRKPLFILKGKEPEHLSKVLVGYDFSEHAQRALDFTVKLLKPFLGELLILHVEETIEIPVVEGIKDVISQKYKEEKEKHLRKLSDSLSKEGFNVKYFILQSSSPAEGIRDFIKGMEDIELVVLGSRGLSGLKRVLVGSTCAELVRSLDLSILVYKGEP